MAPAALAEALPKVPDRHLLLATILAELAPVLDRFAAEGFAALRDDWQALHVRPGGTRSMSCAMVASKCPAAAWCRHRWRAPDRYDPWHRALPVGRSFLAGGLNDRRHRRRQQPDQVGLARWPRLGGLRRAGDGRCRVAEGSGRTGRRIHSLSSAMSPGSRSGVKSMPCSRDRSVRPFISARRPNAVTCSMVRRAIAAWRRPLGRPGRRARLLQSRIALSCAPVPRRRSTGSTPTAVSSVASSRPVST